MTGRDPTGTSTSAVARIALALALFSANAALAQSDRPDESAMFGAPEPAAAADAGAPSSPDGPDAGATPQLPAGPVAPVENPTEANRDASELSGGRLQSQFDTEEVKSDPLRIGGTLYLRAGATYKDGARLADSPLSMPSLVDGYLDARPSDRVRGFLLARMRYDPLYDAGAASPFSCFGVSAPAQPNLRIDLDQLWLRFDVAHKVFVTAGKQHVKWGASRFWNPTDFLSPERKDPLAVFDARLGATMVKVHVPWEAKGWNFYALGLMDNNGPASTIGKLGGAARAEAVFGNSEVAIDAVAVANRSPRLGADFSLAVGPLDVYGEVALRDGLELDAYRVAPGKSNEISDYAHLDFQQFISKYEPLTLTGLQIQSSGGVRTTLNYTDKNAVTVGAEYFYNAGGSEVPVAFLLVQGKYTPFYSGKHYAAAYALAIGLPDLPTWSVSLSTLGNLTDLSFVSRVDVFTLVLGYMSLEVYGAVHYGTRGGELRLGFDPITVKNPITQAECTIDYPPPSVEVGAGLRVAL
jgi:hypothetical protein